MNSETKATIAIMMGIVGIVGLVLFLMVGPQGCKARMSSWKASAYGSDWIVIQYAQNGDVVNSWELRNKAIKNEQQSDGIYFVDSNNNVIHLSGHYTYIQIADGNWDAAKEKYLTKQVERTNPATP